VQLCPSIHSPSPSYEEALTTAASAHQHIHFCSLSSFSLLQGSLFSLPGSSFSVFPRHATRSKSSFCLRAPLHNMSNPNAQSSSSGNPVPSSDPTQQSYIRRSSYASVVAGVGQGNQRNPRHSSGTQSEEYSTGGRGGARGIDSDAGRSHSPWIRPGASGAQEQDGFFIPSYLKSSRYAELLEREHNARLEKSRSRSTSNPPTAARASSNPNNTGTGARRLSSHRGLAHDVVEHAPKTTHVEDVPPPLPTRWNVGDRSSFLEIYNSGLDAKFVGPPRGHDEAGAVRADHPMPKTGGIYYFEIQVLSKGRDG
jgi:hypothetical protein